MKQASLFDGRELKVSPDVIADFTNLPFDDNSFKLVVFDPPHLIKVGKIVGLQKSMESLMKIGLSF